MLQGQFDAAVLLSFFKGMSVTAGRFFGNETSYAAGAPRANGTGQVLIFSKKRPSENPMDVQLILSGEQFASSFGYELTNADVNGDGCVEMICVRLTQRDGDCGAGELGHTMVPTPRLLSAAQIKCKCDCFLLVYYFNLS
jgi:hypothetical protein